MPAEGDEEEQPKSLRYRLISYSYLLLGAMSPFLQAGGQRTRPCFIVVGRRLAGDTSVLTLWLSTFDPE
jgi:hypothetical protein